jgi:hypothetical protein
MAGFNVSGRNDCTSKLRRVLLSLMPCNVVQTFVEGIIHISAGKKFAVRRVNKDILVVPQGVGTNFQHIAFVRETTHSTEVVNVTGII